MPGQLYQVGDNPDGSWNSTTELFAPTRAGQIINQRQLAEAVVSGSGGGREPVQVVQNFHGITNAQEAAAASINRLTFERNGR